MKENPAIMFGLHIPHFHIPVHRLATELKRMNPRWSDETVYQVGSDPWNSRSIFWLQEARRINVAEYQHIVFKEWLPIIIGLS